MLHSENEFRQPLSMDEAPRREHLRMVWKTRRAPVHCARWEMPQ